MGLLLAAMLLTAAPEPPCSLQRIGACVSAYDLVTSRGFNRALRKFVGPGRATWYEPNSSRARQLHWALGVISSDLIPVGQDVLRADGCYPHVCSIRASVFISRDGEIRGAALLYPDCALDTCAGDEPLKLTILRDPRHAAVASSARQWADENIAATNACFDFARERLGTTEIVDVPGGRSAERR